jgi:hypothetical protein
VPAYSAARATFSTAVSVGTRLNAWNTKPISVARIRVRSLNRSWFLVLLLLGIFSFGFVAMIAYLIAGPDATAEPDLRPAHVTS